MKHLKKIKEYENTYGKTPPFSALQVLNEAAAKNIYELKTSIESCSIIKLLAVSLVESCAQNP